MLTLLCGPGVSETAAPAAMPNSPIKNFGSYPHFPSATGMASVDALVEPIFPSQLSSSSLRAPGLVPIERWHPVPSAPLSSASRLALFLLPVAAWRVIRARRTRGVVRRATAQTTSGTEIWALLGLKGTASKAEIKRQFKKFVRQNHPDVKGDRSPAAIERWQAITEAYRSIMKTSDDLFWVESWVARVRQIEMAKLQNADRIRAERMARRAAKAGLTQAEFEVAQEQAAEVAKEEAQSQAQDRNQLVLNIVSVVLPLFLVFLLVSVISIFDRAPDRPLPLPFLRAGPHLVDPAGSHEDPGLFRRARASSVLISAARSSEWLNRASSGDHCAAFAVPHPSPRWVVFSMPGHLGLL
ncbi:DnaJ-like protein 1 [Symbiodinium microadriaticum]|uniref:DnaJ-like protein 1 n=1 Tax=Symbiodinium microadriaticum TaxID=2951 RepID=A0A1Q9DV52_SYMMI|nr:DnaJ-like protein 1 [Symbiodinium microadriaticum]